jgi:hypothetical protein
VKTRIPSLILLACTIACLPSFAEEIRELTWADLSPANPFSEDPLANLTQDERDLGYWVIQTLEAYPERGPDTEEVYSKVDKATAQLKEAGVDIVEVAAKRKKSQTAMVEGLNGKRVRMPGYLLPLEISESGVTEFLLVPYVGACIHVPPPPPNQIVHVNVAHKEGYKSKKLYEPVWVTGVISVKSMVKDLFLVDGSAGINIGYSMRADRIEAYGK